jgi:hypothetical protein
LSARNPTITNDDAYNFAKEVCESPGWSECQEASNWWVVARYFGEPLLAELADEFVMLADLVRTSASDGVDNATAAYIHSLPLRVGAIRAQANELCMSTIRAYTDKLVARRMAVSPS